MKGLFAISNTKPMHKVLLYNPPMYCYNSQREYNCGDHSGRQLIPAFRHISQLFVTINHAPKICHKRKDNSTTKQKYLEAPAAIDGSKLWDISLLVAGTDYYHLEEIRRKHLTLFIPYTVLRLRPKLAPNIAHKLTHKKLTEFVEKVILVLEEELSAGYLSERDYHNYVRLFRFAINRVLAKYPHMREEVGQMMEHAIKLPSEIWDELESELADKKAEISKMKTELENKQAEIAARDSELASSNAEWQHRLAQKDAEIQRLQQLIDKLNYDKEHASL